MPLLDHFRPPIYPVHSWESFHSNWATRIADLLNDRWLSSEFVAEEFTSPERMEVDVAAFHRPPDINGVRRDGSQTAALLPALWTAPAPAATVAAAFPRSFEVKVFSKVGGLELVGAVELVSPGNKDRKDERRAFATKCASYLHEGVSVVVVDIVTTRHASLHNDIVQLLELDPSRELPDGPLYATAYRPVRRDEQGQIDIWKTSFAVGDELPTMPLRLTGDLCSSRSNSKQAASKPVAGAASPELTIAS